MRESTNWSTIFMNFAYVKNTKMILFSMIFMLKVYSPDLKVFSLDISLHVPVFGDIVPIQQVYMYVDRLRQILVSAKDGDSLKKVLMPHLGELGNFILI